MPMLRSCRRARRPSRIVFVVSESPHLNIGDRAVWLRYLALLRGGLGDPVDVDAVKVRPVALVGAAYRELCEFLRTSRGDRVRVRLAPIGNERSGWSIDVAADRQPVRIVAHSMGGLVVRAMMCAADPRNRWRATRPTGDAARSRFA